MDFTKEFYLQTINAAKTIQCAVRCHQARNCAIALLSERIATTTPAVQRKESISTTTTRRRKSVTKSVHHQHHHNNNNNNSQSNDSNPNPSAPIIPIFAENQFCLKTRPNRQSVEEDHVVAAPAYINGATLPRNPSSMIKDIDIIMENHGLQRRGGIATVELPAMGSTRGRINPLKLQRKDARWKRVGRRIAYCIGCCWLCAFILE